MSVQVTHAHLRITNDNTLRRINDLWWPSSDHRAPRNLAYIKNRLTDMDPAIRLAKNRDACIQAGGHVGLWPLRLAKFFRTVTTFEPQFSLFTCLSLNSENRPKSESTIVPTNAALGAVCGTAQMRPTGNPATWRVHEEGRVEVRMVTIDSIAPEICDAIFLDVEGYEPEALEGARNTIERFRPVIQVEELPRSAERIQLAMAMLGYRLHCRVRSDAVYAPR